MAKKKQTEEQPSEGTLTEAAKTIGHIAGKVAVAVGAATPETSAPKKSVKVPKLAPKNKSRLPRREKKARQKAQNKQAT